MLAAGEVYGEVERLGERFFQLEVDDRKVVGRVVMGATGTLQGELQSGLVRHVQYPSLKS